MCGILGWIGPRPFGRDLFRNALRTLEKRGPDDEGIEDLPDAILGHRRLAILDLTAAGHQPMWSADHRYLAVFNGEIYDFLEHRDRLESEGVRLSSRSDTEVLIELFAREGAVAFGRIRGMFALAIWDTQRRSLTLARDPLGERPLYWAAFPGGIAFSSETRALRALPLPVGGDIRPEGIAEYLAWGSAADPTTPFNGISALPAACWESGPAENSRFAGTGTPSKIGGPFGTAEKSSRRFAGS